MFNESKLKRTYRMVITCGNEKISYRKKEKNIKPKNECTNERNNKQHREILFRFTCCFISIILSCSFMEILN